MLTAVCKLCGENATYTFRTSNATGIEVIGGENEYMPLCRECYKEQSKIQQDQREFMSKVAHAETANSNQSLKQGELDTKQS